MGGGQTENLGAVTGTASDADVAPRAFAPKEKRWLPVLVMDTAAQGAVVVQRGHLD